METFEALVNGTVYRNEENGYSVVSVQIGRSEKTVVGVMPALHPGEQAAFEGEWVEHSRFGKQFKCARCTPIAPTTLLGIERFLGSGAIRGVGRKTAKDIVAFFGEDTLVVLATDPERLQEIPVLTAGGQDYPVRSIAAARVAGREFHIDLAQLAPALDVILVHLGKAGAAAVAQAVDLADRLGDDPLAFGPGRIRDQEAFHDPVSPSSSSFG